jgi:hypothetical protein
MKIKKTYHFINFKYFQLQTKSPIIILNNTKVMKITTTFVAIIYNIIEWSWENEE